ncbi:hypothetical protein H6G33_10340 [Calothrix sp. FACHB-1219]|nr:MULTISPECIES: hypothetical protein [unclassified Calothrix]MBD2201745.1 hypothetical protein [Calothrix sp. FACHB-168]MBD2217431.1 hypothetical protein [Calothrix sp. FACHB-1219]
MGQTKWGVVLTAVILIYVLANRGLTIWENSLKCPLSNQPAAIEQVIK